MSSKISGLSLSRCFILSFIAVMMELALSSAPCLDDFSAAPAKHTAQAVPRLFLLPWDAPGRPPRPAPTPATTSPGYNLTRFQLQPLTRIIKAPMSDLTRSLTSSGASRSEREHGACSSNHIQSYAWKVIHTRWHIIHHFQW